MILHPPSYKAKDCNKLLIKNLKSVQKWIAWPIRMYPVINFT